jgi:hypothetical protein
MNLTQELACKRCPPGRVSISGSGSEDDCTFAAKMMPEILQVEVSPENNFVHSTVLLVNLEDYPMQWKFSFPTVLHLAMAGNGNVEDFAPGSAKLAAVKTSLASAARISESLIAIGVKSGSAALEVAVLEVAMPSSAATLVASRLRSGTLMPLAKTDVTNGSRVGSCDPSANSCLPVPATQDDCHGNCTGKS